MSREAYEDRDLVKVFVPVGVEAGLLNKLGGKKGTKQFLNIQLEKEKKRLAKL